MIKLDPAILKLTAEQKKKQKRKITTTDSRVFIFGKRKKRGWALVKALLPKIVEYGRQEGILQAPELSESNAFHTRLLELAQQQQRTGAADDDGLKTTDSTIHQAIPFMPVKVAVACFVLNLVFPGLGTVTIALLTLACIGEPRLHVNVGTEVFEHVSIGNFSDTEGKRLVTALVNLLVGVAQFFTVTFFLVGWFWSIAWGGLFIVYALHYKRMMKQRRAEALAIAAVETFTKNSLLHRSKMRDVIKGHVEAKTSDAPEY